MNIDDIIKPIESFKDHGGTRICMESEVRELEQQHREMFLWVACMLKCADNNDMVKAALLLDLGVELIEKVAKMPWEDVKNA